MKHDADLMKDVTDELAWDRHLEGTQISANVAGGIVTLSGHVDAYSKKLAAQRAALRVAGIRGVVADIEVGVPEAHARTDLEIASAASMALAWNSTVPKNAVKVVVDDGVLTLSGEVAGHFQREAAEKAVRHLSGIKAVQNQITVKPAVASKDVKSRIMAALHRQAQVDAQNIQVAIDGSEVTLSGTVSSWAEREAAMHAAWSAPGVSAVIDKIVLAQ